MAFPPGGVVTGSADLVAAGRRIGDWTYCGHERTAPAFRKYYPGDIDIEIYPGKLI
jgi:hypothetical protein